MTAIAYRAGVMACDTRSELGYLKLNENKIIKKDGYLIGVSGEKCPHNSEIIRWFFLDVKAPRRLKLDGSEFTLLVVTPGGKIQIWDQTGIPYPMPPNVKFWSVGSGAEFCMGAMELGASAERAVKAAIKWLPTVGGNVITKRLK